MSGEVMRAWLGVIVLSLLVGRAAAFEADGFSSGMSEADATKALRTFGDFVKQGASHPDGAIYYSKPPAMFRVLQTCRGKLAAYQVEIPGGWHAFMRTLERESRSLGAGTYALSTSETTYGPSNSLSFEWKLPHGDLMLLSFGQVGDQEPSAYRFLRSPNKCGV
jgi:hypothetical protein